MRLFVPLRRATLLIPSGPPQDPDRMHLFILLTQPQADGRVLLTTVSSVPRGLPHDGTCLLYRGDHPFIRHDSYVFYARSRIEAQSALLNGVNQGVFEAREAMEETLFARVCQGLTASRFTAPAIKTFYEASQS